MFLTTTPRLLRDEDGLPTSALRSHVADCQPLPPEDSGQCVRESARAARQIDLQAPATRRVLAGLEDGHAEDVLVRADRGGRVAGAIASLG